MPGLPETYNKLEQPTRDDGVNEVYYLKATQRGTFLVEAWRDEV